eukprot:CAMPEP_0117675976 /NCGR_PEP_ID=MMETSP0804-20121206/15904_1 /TAXON_ID=1074897 /ORGANISM="Tetraselmis astigmatica, Strain CCMP880" /LENGTH=51 /DNA_ID=CAMNT_0005485039 /DNA_START=878 /DNA_END=1030 /DNA_ORIENTATION=-
MAAAVAWTITSADSNLNRTALTAAETTPPQWLINSLPIKLAPPAPAADFTL